MTATVELAPAALVDQGVARLHAGDPAGAVADLSAALPAAQGADPGRAEALHHRAGAYLAGGELPAALADAEAAVNLAPGRWEFRLTRANVRYHLGQVAAAWVDYQAADALDPAGVAGAVVGTLAEQAARWSRASVRDCDDHLQADPSDFLSLARRGLLSLLGGRAAAADFAAHDRLNPAGGPQLRRYEAEASRRQTPPAESGT